MRGLITERHFEVAERMFPGIGELYRALARKPLTFLELVWEYTLRSDRCQLGPLDPVCEYDDELLPVSGRRSQ